VSDETYKVVEVGDVIEYTIKVTNPNAFKVTGVIVTDSLDASFEKTIDIEADETVSVTFTYTVKAEDITQDKSGENIVLNTAFAARPDETDPPSDSETVYVKDEGPSIMVEKKLAAGQAAVVVVGESIEYVIKVVNTGSVELKDIKLTDIVSSVGLDNRPVSDNLNGQWTQTIESLVPGASQEFTYRYTATEEDSGTIIYNTAVAEAVYEDETVKGEDTSEGVTVTDTAKGSLEITKIRRGTSGSSTVYLAGAHFTILDSNDGEAVYDIVTDSNGKAIVKELEPGEYTLVETRAPSGYEIIGIGRTSFIIVADETAQLTIENRAASIIGGDDDSDSDSDSDSDTDTDTDTDTDPVIPPGVPDGMTAVPTNIPDVYTLLDESGTPLGNFMPVTNDDGETEWIEVDESGLPLGSLVLNDLQKQNPKTHDIIDEMIYYTASALVLILALALHIFNKKRGIKI